MRLSTPRLRAAVWLVAACTSGVTLSSCSGLLRLPGGQIDVSQNGFSLDVPGALVTVNRNQITIDLVSVDLELSND